MQKYTVDMLPTRVDFKIKEKTDVNIEWTFLDVDGTAFDITNDSITLTVVEFGSEGPTTVVTVINGVGDHSDPTNGKTITTITDTDLTLAASFPVQESKLHYYEVVRITGAGEVQVFFEGEMRVYSRLVE